MTRKKPRTGEDLLSSQSWSRRNSPAPAAAPSSTIIPPLLLLQVEIPQLQPSMSITSQAAARCCRQLVRPSTRLSSSSAYLSQQRIPSRRWQSTEAEPAAAAAPSNPKIAQIVDQVSQLSLLETAELVSSLKVGCFLSYPTYVSLRLLYLSIYSSLM